MGLHEDPKPSWVTALRPQTGLRQDSTGAERRWNCQQRWPQQTILFFTPAVDVCWIQRIQRSSLQNPPGIPARPESCSFPVLAQISNTPRPCQIQIKLIPLFGEYMMYMRQNMTFHSLSSKSSNSCDSKNDVIHFPRHRCHVGHLHHTKLFGTIVAQVRSHAANDA